MLPFVSNEDFFYPKEDILKLIESLPFNRVLNFLSGQSLKYLRSEQPVLVFSVPSPYFEETLALSEKYQEKEKFKILKFPHNYKIILNTKDLINQEFHLIIQKPFLYPQILISVDRLLFDYQKKEWKGNAEDLNDFYTGTLRIVKPQGLTLKHMIQLFVYASLLNFNFIESVTYEKIKNTNLERDFFKLDMSFLRNQLSKILTSSKPSRAFIFLEEFGILKSILPELSIVKGFKLNESYKNDLFYHSVYNCDSIYKPILHLRMAALFKDIGKYQENQSKENEKKYISYNSISASITQKILRRFRFPQSLVNRVDFLIRNNLFFYSQSITEKSLRKFVRKISEEELQDLIQFKLYERKKNLYHPLPPQIRRLLYIYKEEKQKEQELKVRDLKISGEDLKNLAIPFGPIYGKTLKFLLERVKNQEIPNEKDILLQEAKSFLFQEGFSEKNHL
ncbi:MAG: hypothetical protein ACK4UJ_12410 [Leptonema sp. (in: bacteria)]